MIQLYIACGIKFLKIARHEMRKGNVTDNQEVIPTMEICLQMKLILELGAKEFIITI